MGCTQTKEVLGSKDHTIEILVDKPQPIEIEFEDDIPSNAELIKLSEQGLVKTFNMKGEICLAYCQSLYDGDTFTLNINSKQGLFQWKCRTRYDTPEIKLKKSESQNKDIILEKIHGLVCRDILSDIILGKVIIIYCHGSSDKYGRQLVDIFGCVDSIGETGVPRLRNANKDDLQSCMNSAKILNLSKWMVDNTPSYEYNGKGKIPFNYTRKFVKGYYDKLDIHNKNFITNLQISIP